MKRERSGSPSCSDENSNLPGDEDKNISDGEVLTNVATQSLGVFLWGEVSMVLYVSVVKQLHYTCGILAMEKSKGRRDKIIASLREKLMAFWESVTSELTTEEREKLGVVFFSYLNTLLERMLSLAAMDMTPGEFCGVFLKTLEEFGLPEEENTDEAQLQANMRKCVELHGYSYHKRTSHHLGVLPRYEGDRRTEEQHRLPRVGRVVHFPCPHPLAEINTEVQLIEPKRRRPPLDENRIFSHPKKATYSGIEDLLVDDELQYRSLVVLGRHLDTFGSLQHLSPFVRFLLWNLLERDDELFERLCSLPAHRSEALWQQQQIEALRRCVGEKRAAFEATRAAAREVALRIGWSAVSAHWRDQVLHIVEDCEDADWYLLRDSIRSGGRGIFPNYAVSLTVREIAEKALRRARDGHIDCGVEDASQCFDVIMHVLFPLLEGVAPSFPPLLSSTDDRLAADDALQREELQKKVAALLIEESAHVCGDAEVARATRWNLDCDTLLPQDGVTCAFVSDMFVWPLQCLATFLELIAVARYSGDGIRKFFSAFLSSNCGDGEALLEFLVRREPMNIPLTAFVAFPRLLRDVFTSAQWLRNDKCFTAVVECQRQVSVMSSNAPGRNYMQWCALSALLRCLGYKGDLLSLTVREALPHAADEGKLWSVAELQCTPKTWIEGVKLMLTANPHRIPPPFPLASPPASSTVASEHDVANEGDGCGYSD